MRRILYEEVQPIDETKPLEDQNALKTAYEAYKSYSLSKEEILENRKIERLRKKVIKYLLGNSISTLKFFINKK